MESTERLSLPLLIAGQAQKELTHNEALQILDIAVAGSAEALPANDPPATPLTGSTYLVGNAPTGEWSQYPGHVAGYGSAGWRFVAPSTGMSVYVKSTGTVAVFGSAGWDVGTVRASTLVINGQQVVGPRALAIADPAGGTAIDAEARSSISQILAVLRQHGLISL